MKNSTRKWFIALLSALLFGLVHSSTDPYSILRVNRNASQEEIRKSYKTLCLRYHPDKNIGRSPAERKQCEETFKEVQKAYSLIGNPESRKNHDLLNRFGRPYGSSPQQPGQPPWYSSSGSTTHARFNPEDFFQDFFGQRGQREWHSFGAPGAFASRAPSDFFNLSRFKSIYIQKVPVSLEDLYAGKHGHEFSLKLSLWKRLTASFRGGSGFVLLYQSLLFTLPMIRFSKLLSVAFGAFLFFQHIPYPSKVNFFADLKAGYKGGTKFTFSEESFDAVFILQETEHPRFSRHGNDLYTALYVTSRQARRGAIVETTHLDGSKLEVQLPAGVRSGNLIRLSNQGWPDRKNKSRGDLYINIFVQERSWRRW